MHCKDRIRLENARKQISHVASLLWTEGHMSRKRAISLLKSDGASLSPSSIEEAIYSWRCVQDRLGKARCRRRLYIQGRKRGRPYSKDEILSARKAAHNLFDEIWKRGLMSRREAYVWLTKKMGYQHVWECHIRFMTPDECRLLKQIVRNFIAGAEKKEEGEDATLDRARAKK